MKKAFCEFLELLKEQYIKTAKYFKQTLLKLSVLMAIVFIASSVISYFVMHILPSEKIQEILEGIRATIRAGGSIRDDGSLSFFGLFLNNLRASLIAYVCGIVPFVFFPVWTVVSNGIMAGQAVGIAAQKSAESTLMLIAKYILPHGVLELPTIFISGAMGVNLCILVIKKIFKYKKCESARQHFIRNSMMMYLYIVPLLFVAAFIETIILPALLGM